MIGKLSYEQIDQLIQTLSVSANNLKNILLSYKGDEVNNMKAAKLLNFCDELDKYVNNLKDTITLNKDADIVVNKLKDVTM